MAYSRPMYRRRAPARKYQTRPRSTKSIYTKKVKPSRYALPALARQVTALKRKVTGTTSEIQYGVSVSNPVGTVGATTPYVLPLSQFSGWTRVFGADADDESNHRALWKKSNFDFQIDGQSESDSIDYTMYIVSLTKAGQEELFTQATGTLNGPLGASSITNTTHFWVGGTWGMAMLNRKYFNIHYCRRLMTGVGTGATVNDINTNRKRGYFKLLHNGGKGHIITNPKGDWKAMASPQVANQNYYVILFNNDSTVDAQTVQFKLCGLHTLQIS